MEGQVPPAEGACVTMIWLRPQGGVHVKRALVPSTKLGVIVSMHAAIGVTVSRPQAAVTMIAKAKQVLMTDYRRVH